jgi:hypothetical protein
MNEPGDPKKAIVYYKRALELEPGNHGAEQYQKNE